MIDCEELRGAVETAIKKEERLRRLESENAALKATMHKIATENLGAINDHDWKRRAKVIASNAIKDAV